MVNLHFQAELESVSSSYEDADGKVAGFSKQVASLESQLADAQELLQDETRQKLQSQSRVRQLEEQWEAAQDQLEEDEEARKSMENKINHLNAAVCTYQCLCLLLLSVQRFRL